MCLASGACGAVVPGLIWIAGLLFAAAAFPL